MHQQVLQVGHIRNLHRRCGFDGSFQNLEEDELVACGDEGLRRLALTETINDLASLPEPRCKAREITVAGYQAEAVDVA
jgi:hypothetical protein